MGPNNRISHTGIMYNINNAPETPKNSGSNFMNKLFSWKSLSVFLVLSISLLVFMFSQRSSFSSQDISIFIEGPDQFKAEEPTEFEVGFVNNSEVDLREGVLHVSVPDFMEFEHEKGIEKKYEFNSIKTGERFSQKIIVKSHESNVSGEIRVGLDYVLSNFNKGFASEGSKNISVTSLPITVIFNLPEKVVSGQTVEGSFDFVADEDFNIELLYAKLEVPDGFTFKDAAPSPYDENIWKFDNVKPGDNFRVEFEGPIRGKESEVKEFKLMFGKLEEGIVFSPQYQMIRQVSISSSSLALTETVNGKEGEYFASIGEKLNISINYENKSGVEIEDVVITARLTSDILDFETINSERGYFNRDTKSIVWNKNFVSDLESLKDGESGMVSFSVTLENEIAPLNYKDKNKSASIIVVMEPTKTPLSLRGMSLRAENESLIKLRTKLNVTVKGYYYEGPFSNTGPVPPLVNQKTSYTLFLQASNTTNDANDVEIIAPLPSYMKFEGNVYPDENNFEYDQRTNTVTWSIGKLQAGVGSVLPAESVAFQVSLTPDESMRGKTPVIMDSLKIVGKDSFTGEFLEEFSGPLDTSLPDDGGVGENDGIVQ